MNMSKAGQLLGSYLHQDWPDEFESDQAALKAIVESEPREQLAAAVAEIDALLSALPSEEELRTIVEKQLGCYFDPASKGLSYAVWLQQVRGFFAKSL